MAQKTVVTLLDDLDGSEATQTVLFGLEGRSYEIDLNEANSEKFRAALAPYVGAARKASSSRSIPVRRIGSGKPANKAGDVREWARMNGLDVNDRGRVPAEIVKAFEAAHAA